MKKLVFLLLINFIFSFDNVSKEYIDLINWVKSNGGKISDKITINEKDKNNRYLYAKEKGWFKNNYPGFK